MTSDSSSAKHQRAMVLVQPPAPPPYRSPLATLEGPTGGHAIRSVESGPPMDPSRKTFSETSRLLNTASTSSSAPTTLYYSSVTMTMQTQVDRERVHPWNTTSAATRSGENVDSENTKRAATGAVSGSDSPKTTMLTRFLTHAHALTSSRTAFSTSSTHPAKPSTQRRRHSILRVNSSKALGEKPIKKSASVEFVLYHEETQKLEIQDRRATTSNSTPRRLTFEEKEELYRVRPDLEIGPTPFYKEQMLEREQQNQRRMVFAIVGGFLSIMFLMVVYYMFTIVTST